MLIRFIPAVLVAVVIALVAAGGAALAFGLRDNGSEAREDLLARAAAELGVEQQALEDALAQAQAEIAAERLAEVLADLVEDEVITQEQADEAEAWFGRMPSAAGGLLHPGVLLRLAAAHGPELAAGALESHGAFRLSDDVKERVAGALGITVEELEQAFENARQAQAEARRAQLIDEFIARLVEDGEITEAEGDEIKAWLESMPEWLTDHRVLLSLFKHGAVHFAPEGRPFFFAPREGELHLLPGLEEFRHGRPFRSPEDRFELPKFDLTIPGDGGERERFFFHSPEGGPKGGLEGRFEFNGLLPEEVLEMLEDLEKRSGGGFEFDGLNGLFQRSHPFTFPQDDDDATEPESDREAAEKGA